MVTPNYVFTYKVYANLKKSGDVNDIIHKIQIDQKTLSENKNKLERIDKRVCFYINTLIHEDVLTV